VSALDRDGPEELWRPGGKRHISVAILHCVVRGGPPKAHPKPEPGEIVLHDADGKIGSYSYFTVFAALANRIFPSSQEKFWAKQEH
jgi:hypothetical protein